MTEADSLSPATRADIERTAQDVHVSASKLFALVCRCLEREYPHGPLGDAIRAQAACVKHSQQWCYCRDAVIDEVYALADALRAAKGA